MIYLYLRPPEARKSDSRMNAALFDVTSCLLCAYMFYGYAHKHGYSSPCIRFILIYSMNENDFLAFYSSNLGTPDEVLMNVNISIE